MKKQIVLQLRIIRLRVRRFFCRMQKRSSVPRWAFYGVGCVVAVCLVSVIVQLAFPQDRLTARAQIAGQPVGWWTRSDIEKVTGQAGHVTNVKFLTADGHTSAPIAQFGGRVCTNCMADAMLDYPLWQRLVPFSMLWRSVNIEHATVVFDENALEAKMAEYSGKLTLQPENARVEIRDNQVEIVPEKAGRELGMKEARSAISSARYHLGQENTIEMNGKVLPAKITEKQLQELRAQVEKVLKRELVLQHEDNSATLDKPKIATLLSFIQGEDDMPKLAINQEKLSALLESNFGKKINKPAGKTIIHLSDGNETMREAGPAGQGIDIAAMTDRVKALLFSDNPTAPISVAVKALPPQQIYKETFSSSPAGLQAYVNSLSRDADIRLTVSQIGGNQWTAQTRGTEPSVSASTYKLYIAMFLMDRIDAKQLSMSDSINGVSVQECITRMIVNSDNACPEAVIAKYKASALTTYLQKDKGLSATSLNGPRAMTSTNDLAALLKGIEKGTLARGAHHGFLLGLMQRQVYRQGVPAGSAGVVQDKVGFLEGYLNDAAIVHHPKGKYVISIITKGQSWGKIAEITRKLEEIMYP